MPGTQVQPYLFFGGRCEEAIAFYKSAIGAQIDMMMRFSDSPDPVPADKMPPGSENKIMHASFRVGDSVIMASDGCGADSKFEGFSLSITTPTIPEAEQAFAALSKGGSVTMPLDKTFWSPAFGMLTDKYGVAWMVTVEHKPAPERATAPAGTASR